MNEPNYSTTPDDGHAFACLASPSRSTEEIAASFKLTPAARKIAVRDVGPAEYFDLLVAQNLTSDAIRFIARALPKRLSIWWGALCVWDATRGASNAVGDAALAAAVTWIIEPTEANRLATREPGRRASARTPAGCLALAALWSSGSLSRPGLPVVAPPVFLTGRLVGGAVLLSAAAREPMKYREHYHKYLALARSVAACECLWFDDLPSAESAVETDRAEEPDRKLVVHPRHEAALHMHHRKSMVHSLIAMHEDAT